jgi:D-apiose dehydrogenase
MAAEKMKENMEIAQPMRIGLAGAGYVSDLHLNAWRNIDGVLVVAICDPDRNRAMAQAKKHHIKKIFTDAADMMASCDLDAVDIAAPREAHVALIRLAALQGIDVLCQKPLAPDVHVARDLANDIGDDIRVMVHENWRFRPYFRQIRTWIDAGRLGSIHQVRITARSCGLLPDDKGVRPALAAQPFMANEPRLLIAELLIHHIDVVRWLFGPLRLTAACAQATQPDLPGETAATLLFENPARVCITVEGNMAVPGAPVRPADGIEVIGEKGTAVLHENTLCLSGQSTQRIDYPEAGTGPASFQGAIAHFVQCLNSGTEFETSLADNLDTLQLVEDAYTFLDRSLAVIT